MPLNLWAPYFTPKFGRCWKREGGTLSKRANFFRTVKTLRALEPRSRHPSKSAANTSVIISVEGRAFQLIFLNGQRSDDLNEYLPLINQAVAEIVVGDLGKCMRCFFFNCSFKVCRRWCVVVLLFLYCRKCMYEWNEVEEMCLKIKLIILLKVSAFHLK